MNSSPLHSVSVAGVTFDDAGRVLLIRRRDNGQWQAPGGVLELSEVPEQGVVREVLEETGVLVEVEHLTGVYKNIPRHVVALVYKCRVVGGQPEPAKESREVAWMSLENAVSLMTPAFYARVEDAVPGHPWVASRSHDGENLILPS